jgi:Mlc titration factor MtfA (ptsG expression regulator)
LPVFLVLGLVLLVVAWLLWQPLAARQWRERLERQPFPAQWRAIIRRRVPYYRRLPPDLQTQLRKRILIFVAEKAFIGCNGLVITDEIRVTIAAQACLLILNRRTDCYPDLRQVLVYPGAFVVDRVQTDGIGVLQEQRRVLSGESWSQGQVILSWDDVLEGAAVVDDGRNVVIHEFAHQLDQQAGYANGAPILARRERYSRWARVMSEEFARLQDDVRGGRDTLLSHYGATSPAEFFAVVSEAFFERPDRLAAEHADLYRELERFYRVDPLSW